MATKTFRNSSSQLAGVINSEKIYNELAYIAWKLDLIKVPRFAQSTLTELSKRGFIGNYNYGSLVISDSADTMHKVQMLMSGLAHTPVKESNLSSKRQMELLNTIDILHGLTLKRFGTKDAYCYQLTLTAQSCDKGQLPKMTNNMIKAVRRLMRHLERSDSHFKGYKFGGTGLGGFARLEFTENEDKIAALDPTLIWHPHFHLLLFSAVKIGNSELKKASHDIYQNWDQITDDYGLVTNEQAFKLEGTYITVYQGNNAIKVPDPSGTAGIKEAIKYEVKPTTYNSFELSKDVQNANSINDLNPQNRFKLELFAELYNTFNQPKLDENGNYQFTKTGNIKTKKLRFDPFGAFKEAKSVFNLMKDKKLLGFFAYKLANDDPSAIPTLFTKSHRLYLDGQKANPNSKSGYTYYAHFSDESSFSAAELLYYNKSQIELSIFDNFSREAFSKAFDDIFKVDNPELYLKPRYKDLKWLIENWFNIANSDDDALNAYADYEKTAFEASATDDTMISRMGDIQAMKGALEAELHDNLRSHKVRNFSRIWKRDALNSYFNENDISDDDKKAILNELEVKTFGFAPVSKPLFELIKRYLLVVRNVALINDSSDKVNNINVYLDPDQIDFSSPALYRLKRVQRDLLSALTNSNWIMIDGTVKIHSSLKAILQVFVDGIGSAKHPFDHDNGFNDCVDLTPNSDSTRYLVEDGFVHAISGDYAGLDELERRKLDQKYIADFFAA